MSTMRVCSLSLCALMLALGCKTSTSGTAADGVAAGPAAPTGNAETGAPMTLEELAAGAVLLDGLGDHRRPVTTRSTEAQAFFDPGPRSFT